MITGTIAYIDVPRSFRFDGDIDFNKGDILNVKLNDLCCLVGEALEVT